MATNNTPQEEVDLGKLFQIIGNGFKKLFNAIGSLIKSIFHYGILLLLFFKKNVIKLGIATILGGVLGYVLDLNEETVYTSNMIVETNFGSGHRLYNQLDYLNTLISEEDTITLGKLFNIEATKASKLSSFSAEPYDEEKNLKVQYDYYMQHTDTIHTRGFDLEDFKERLSKPDYRFQTIIASSSESKIFNHLKKGIINLVKNDHLKKLYDLKISELEIRKKIIKNDLIVIDSLRNLYKKVALLNANNSNTPNTNIDLSGKTTLKNRDVELFKENSNLISGLRSVNNQMVRSGFIMNVISEFNTGKVTKSIKKEKWFRYAFLGFGLTLLVILGFKVNAYLSNYEKNIST